MWIDRGRKKKLTVAFHFQHSNQAAWRCDVCRNQGLEKTRRCGWLSDTGETAKRVIWAKGRLSLTTCPRSYITAESIGWLEAYQAWRAFGFGNPAEMPARDVEAFFVLENENNTEKRRDQ
jgi:hypothetical protein